MKKILYSIIALLCMVAQGLVLTACSSNDDNTGESESPETDAYNVFDDLDYFQRAIVQKDAEGNLAYFHFGKVLDPNKPKRLYIGVDSWEEAVKIFRYWIAPDVVLTDIVPGTRGEVGGSLGLKGDFTDSQGNSQGTVFLKPGEDPYIAEVSYSDESQLEDFSAISFVSNGYELWWNSTDGHHWHLGDVVAFIRLTSSNKIEDKLNESDKRLNFVCIREQSNGINPLFAAITNHDGYKCGGGIYPAYMTIRSSHFTPDEAQAGMIRNLMAGRWDAFVNDFKKAECGPLTENCDYFIDRDHRNWITTYYDTYSYKSGFINGILVGGHRRFLLYFDNYPDEEILTGMTVYRGARKDYTHAK